jgi:hypothetical protein
MEIPLLKNNSIKDSVGYEENGYPLPDLNKTTIKVTKEFSNAHKKPSKKDFREKILDKANQNVQDALKKF